MKKNVYDFFQDLEEKKLPRRRGVLQYDGEKIVYPFVKSNYYDSPSLSTEGRPYDTGIYQHTTVDIQGTTHYIKGLWEQMSIGDIASTKMYNDLGLITPPLHMLRVPDSSDIKLATQSVGSIKGIDTVIAHCSVVEEKVFSREREGSNKWDILYNDDLRQKLRQYMTPECLDEFVSMHLLDELRTESDRHLGNYFFYKKNGAKKYEGIIPIDNEFLEILYQAPCSQSRFEDFLKLEYSTATPLMSQDNESYLGRMKNLKQAIADGKLSPSQISIMKEALAYDLPQAVKDARYPGKFKAQKNIAYDITSRLWDYHNGVDGIAREM